MIVTLLLDVEVLVLVLRGKVGIDVYAYVCIYHLLLVIDVGSSLGDVPSSKHVSSSHVRSMIVCVPTIARCIGVHHHHVLLVVGLALGECIGRSIEVLEVLLLVFLVLVASIPLVATVIGKEGVGVLRLLLLGTRVLGVVLG